MSLPATAPIRLANYNGTAIALHWVMAVLIGAGFTLGLRAADLHFSPQKVRLESYHKWVGISVLALVVVRGVWRLTHHPPLLLPMPVWQRVAAQMTHVLLYALIVVIPIVGWMTSSAHGVPVVYLGLLRLPDLIAANRQLYEVLRAIHADLAWLLAGAVALHSAAALKHHFVDHDDTLRRMLPMRGGSLRSTSS